MVLWLKLQWLLYFVHSVQQGMLHIGWTSQNLSHTHQLNLTSSDPPWSPRSRAFQKRHSQAYLEDHRPCWAFHLRLLPTERQELLALQSCLRQYSHGCVHQCRSWEDIWNVSEYVSVYICVFQADDCYNGITMWVGEMVESDWLLMFLWLIWFLLLPWSTGLKEMLLLLVWHHFYHFPEYDISRMHHVSWETVWYPVM